MNTYLQLIAAKDPGHNLSVLADGILWADQSCRISGTLALAIRNASSEQIDAILDKMIADSCVTMADACRWLNANYSDVLETCTQSV